MIHSRPPPKVYHLLIKTHKTTIVVTTAPTASVASVKSEVLSALTSDVNKDTETPQVSSEDDFDLCKPFKEKGKPTGAYEVVDTSLQVKQAGINNWEHLFIKFHDAESGMCYIHPIVVRDRHCFTNHITSFTLPLCIQANHFLSSTLSRVLTATSTRKS
ncbi:hypothetical protein BDN71DRAFT_1443085 [Pleurotus eryngii]|uniref:Uncharacterized protein n=1 Tax=Pleurotus eryngii TaxID=5323 RepID=A0A9P6A3P8_PLEER|nr:hypothetical protein BDN71DRAFT_1443085 [Pleurotus eryngii]